MSATIDNGDRHQECIAVESLPQNVAEFHVFRVRQWSKHLMEKRTLEIDGGLRHLSPAMAESVAKFGE